MSISRRWFLAPLFWLAGRPASPAECSQIQIHIGPRKNVAVLAPNFSKSDLAHVIATVLVAAAPQKLKQVLDRADSITFVLTSKCADEIKLPVVSEGQRARCQEGAKRKIGEQRNV